MNSFGFGLEKLGLLVLRLPRLFAALVVLAILASVAAVPSLRFDGNILHMLTKDSDAFRSYREVQRDFRDFSGDLAVLVRAKGLYTPQKLEELRNFHLDLTLVDGVESVYSLFSASKVDPQSGVIEPVVPDEIASGADVPALIRDLSGQSQIVNQLARVDRNAALIELETDLGELQGQGSEAGPVLKLISEIRDLAPADFTVDFAGFPLMRADAVDALISDQILLTAVGLALATAIAFAIFRAALPTLLCLAPSVIALLWVMGSFALSDTEVSFLSTTLPIIAMVLALADAVMLYFAWETKRLEGLTGREAIAEAVRRTGPANAMTSITTAVAFASFGFSSNPALRSLAMLGSTSVIVAFVAVLTTLPLGLLFFGDRVKIRTRHSLFTFVGPWTARFAAWHPRLIATGGVVLTVLCLSGHFFGQEAHQITDHVPRNSEAARGEELTRDIFGGVAPLYVPLAIPDGMDWTDPAALARLRKAHEAVAEAVGARRTYSLASIVEGGPSAEVLAKALEDAPAGAAGRFLSTDRRQYLITGVVPYGMDPQAVLALAGQIDANLAAAGLPRATVTGYPILSAAEIPDIIRQLKRSLIIAIILGVGVVMLSSRRPVVAMAALAPNMLPVLFVETALWLMGRPMDIPHVIALTIAFGISIDNAIHIINIYLANRERGLESAEAMRQGLDEVAPALISATVMFVGGSVGTTLSSLPAVSDLGFLIIATLGVALLSNLMILPALILSLERLIPSDHRMLAAK